MMYQRHNKSAITNSEDDVRRRYCYIENQDSTL
jgi:hypothetical protein